MSTPVERWTEYGLVTGMSAENAEKVACLLDNQVLDMERNIDNLSSLGPEFGIWLPLIRFVFEPYNCMAVTIPRVIRQDGSPGKSFKRQRLGRFQLSNSNVVTKADEVRDAFNVLADGQMLYVNVPFIVVETETINNEQFFTLDTLVGIDN